MVKAAAAERLVRSNKLIFCSFSAVGKWKIFMCLHVRWFRCWGGNWIFLVSTVVEVNGQFERDSRTFFFFFSLPQNCESLRCAIFMTMPCLMDVCRGEIFIFLYSFISLFIMPHSNFDCDFLHLISVRVASLFAIVKIPTATEKKITTKPLRRKEKFAALDNTIRQHKLLVSLFCECFMIMSRSLANEDGYCLGNVNDSMSHATLFGGYFNSSCDGSHDVSCENPRQWPFDLILFNSIVIRILLLRINSIKLILWELWNSYKEFKFL